jgi:hypothetical protein
VAGFVFFNIGFGLDWAAFKKRESPKGVREAHEELGLTFLKFRQVFAMRRGSMKHFTRAVLVNAVTPLPATVTQRK